MITRLLFLTSTLFILPLSITYADNSIERLHTDNCVSCHSQMTDGTGEVLYTRNIRLATNENELKQILIDHRRDLVLTLDQGTLDNLYDYLNTRYYQFEPSLK